MKSLDVNDLFDAPAGSVRIPRDRFEEAMFFAHIQRTVEGWAQNTYTASVLRGTPQGGRWSLMIAERRGPIPASITVGMPDPTQWPRAERGHIWIEDRNGRPVVAWEIAGQRNEATYAPVNPWGEG